MKTGLLRAFFSITMLFISIGLFAQEVSVIQWAYGLDTSFGLSPGNEIPNSFSLSFQSHHRYGSGWSIDWINKKQTVLGEYLGEYSEINGSQNGVLGSLYLGFPIGKIFRPYVGGGIGIGFYFGDNMNNTVNEDIYFAWKLDAGVVAWPTDGFYIKTGYSYDNIRQHSISVGFGFLLQKEVTDTYRNENGSTFRRTWKRYLWDINDTPNRIYGDTFTGSEVIRVYEQTTNNSVYNPAQYEIRTSGGEVLRTEFRDQYGMSIGSATTTTPRRTETVQTQAANVTTYYYKWQITVTRNWYTRTWYYKDRAPTTERIYQDVESAVLLDNWMRTIR